MSNRTWLAMLARIPAWRAVFCTGIFFSFLFISASHASHFGGNLVTQENSQNGWHGRKVTAPLPDIEKILKWATIQQQCILRKEVLMPERNGYKTLDLIASEIGAGKRKVLDAIQELAITSRKFRIDRRHKYYSPEDIQRVKEWFLTH